MNKKRLNIQGIELELELNEHIFPPSQNGLFYAESIRVNPGETVIDIGTGSGVLGIFAAKQGGIVSATDIDHYAIETAKRNASLNKVRIEFCQGTLFADFAKKFDVILANLPNEIVPQVYLDSVGGELAHTFDGGDQGNKHILDLLKAAKMYMHERSRLYLPVHTLTAYHETLREVISHFKAQLIAIAQLPTKEFVQENIDLYLELNKAGTIRIFLHQGKWHSNGYIFEVSV